MPDRTVRIIADPTADTRLVTDTSSAGATTALLTNDTMLTTSHFTARNLEVVKQTVAASAFTAISATVATMQLTGTVPEGAVIAGVILAVGTKFDENGTATLQIGDRTDVHRYHSAPVAIQAAFAATALSPYNGSQIQGLGARPTLTITAPSSVALIIAGAGSLTVSIYYEATSHYWCCDTSQYINHTLYFPKKMGTCILGSAAKVTKLTNAQADQVAEWFDYYFAVQQFLDNLTPTSPITAASKYILLTTPFTLEPYASLYSLSVLFKIVDGYALGYPLDIPHYTVTAEEYKWCSDGFDAMDFAQTLIRDHFIVP